MSSYTGPATLILDGSREAGTVTLHADPPQSPFLKSWEGTFRPDNPGVHVLNAVGRNVAIELPNGQTGEVLIQSLVGGGSIAPVFRLLGSGPAPL